MGATKGFSIPTNMHELYKEGKLYEITTREATEEEKKLIEKRQDHFIKHMAMDIVMRPTEETKIQYARDIQSTIMQYYWLFVGNRTEGEELINKIWKQIPIEEKEVEKEYETPLTEKEQKIFEELQQIFNHKYTYECERCKSTTKQNTRQEGKRCDYCSHIMKETKTK